jgi:hypothetical protein
MDYHFKGCSIHFVFIREVLDIYIVSPLLMYLTLFSYLIWSVLCPNYWKVWECYGF